jgi:hypothetical protein
MHAAKGIVAVGKMHKHDHINFLLCGEMLVFSSVDEEPVHVIGPAFFWGKAMTRKAALFLEDTIWANVHFTDKTDVDEIEKDVIAEDYDVLEFNRKELPWHGQ